MAVGALVPQVRWAAQNNGSPLPGAKLYTWLSGTSTPQAVYSDHTLLSAHTNPVVADGNGLFPVMYMAAVAYRMELQSSAGVVIIPAMDQIYDFGQVQLAASGGSALIGFIQAGAGAVARTAQSKMREVVSATDYGAVGDGVVNDQAALQAGLTYLASVGGGTLEIGEGTFSFNQLDIPSNIRMVGAGRGVTILKKRDDTSPLLNGSDTSGGNTQISIEHLTIDGNRAAIEGSIVGGGNAMGVRMDRWSYCTLRDLEIKDCATDGIYMGASANDRTHINEYCLIDNVDVSNSRRNGLSIITACRCWFTHSTFRTSSGTAPEAGIDIEPDSAFGRLEDLYFSDIVCTENDADGFAIFLSLVSIEQVRIYLDRCVAWDNGNRGFRVARMDDDADGGIIQLTDCSATDNSGAGFLIDEKSVAGARVRLINPFAKDNAQGTINDGGSTSRSQIKLYASGVVGATTTPGGVDVYNPYGELTAGLIDTTLFRMDGNVDWDDVTLTNARYKNAVTPTTIWSLSNFKVIAVSGITDANFRQVTKTSGAVLTMEESDSFTIFNNAGSATTNPFTLPAATAPADGTVRVTFRVLAAQFITITPASGEQIMDLTGAVDTLISSNVIGSYVVLENAALGKWRVVSNSGFGPPVGTVTQQTDKSTAVELNALKGAITMNAAALNAATTVSFTLTNSAITSTSRLILNHVSGGTAGAYTLNAQPTAGSASIAVRNVTAGNLSEAIVIGFTVIQGVTP